MNTFSIDIDREVIIKSNSINDHYFRSGEYINWKDAHAILVAGLKLRELIAQHQLESARAALAKAEAITEPKE